MAYLFQVSQKLKRGLRGISTCVIRGKYQDIHFPQCMFESITEHAARYPLFSNVPDGRVIPVVPHRPIQLQDHWRGVLFSGLVHSVNCKTNYDSISNAFDLDNVGVLKNLNVIAFRRFQRMDGRTNTNHDEYCSFIRDLFIQLYGPEALNQLVELDDYLSLFGNGLPLNDAFLLHNPIFLKERDIANFYIDVHRLVRHEFPMRRRSYFADRILEDLESKIPNFECIRTCENSLLLSHLLGAHSVKPRAISVKRSSWPPGGSTVVDVHRHGVIHCIERTLLKDIRAGPLPIGFSDLLNRYTRQEVVEGLRHQFPRYPQVVAKSFEEHGVWHTLGMHRRLPVPSIYGYVAPR